MASLVNLSKLVVGDCCAVAQQPRTMCAVVRAEGGAKGFPCGIGMIQDLCVAVSMGTSDHL